MKKLIETLSAALPLGTKIGNVNKTITRIGKKFDSNFCAHEGEETELTIPFETTLGGERQWVSKIKVDDCGTLTFETQEGNSYTLDDIWPWETFELIFKLQKTINEKVSAKMLI